jgi:hypothetical protein
MTTQSNGAEGTRLEQVTTERTTLVRRSVDLSLPQNAKLTEWCNETAVQFGTARVTGQDVLRALVRRLLTDATLGREIRADLADDLESS